MVVDASAVIELFKEEPSAPSIEAALNGATILLMSSVTLTEVALPGLRRGESAVAAASKVARLGIRIAPVDETLAIDAAEARHRYPIRFGDTFVYALAKARRMPILTLDAEFAKTDAALVPLV